MAKIKIGIVGSRRRDEYRDYKKIKDAFDDIYEEDDWIVSGGCPEGGDRFAEDIAKNRGIPILIFYPNWNKYRKGAGFVRNTFIAEESDVLIACVAKDRKGGTEDTIKKFLRRGKKRGIQENKLYLV
ncbi:hypothetical protein LCGC14_1637410 [marine sediment metagenome]|uniref:YspA cpYpsA-related SLOG domain-containing protein n=1 Tax=marine sediment metagenome TaxID=412755 RepID=A0A0F9IN52_9ZZZZ